MLIHPNRASRAVWSKYTPPPISKFVFYEKVVLFYKYTYKMRHVLDMLVQQTHV